MIRPVSFENQTLVKYVKLDALILSGSTVFRLYLHFTSEPNLRKIFIEIHKSIIQSCYVHGT